MTSASPVATTMASDNRESYPAQSFSLVQLLSATKSKLEDAMLGGRTTRALIRPELDTLERDASEVLRLVRSIKNTSVPINQIPSEILSLVPDYSTNTDVELVGLTHVCRGWREIFTSRSSLWASLDCIDVHQTLTYLKRSKSFPLNVRLERQDDQSYNDDALSLVAPHVGRLRSLTVYGTAAILPDLTREFSCPTPLLMELEIRISFDNDNSYAFPAALFSGDLSSLCRLNLSGFSTNLPWRNLVNLTTFRLSYVPETAHPFFITRLLDFFESAPLLSIVELRSIPGSPGPSPDRVVPIPHLKELIISSVYAHSILAKHLSIPTGASLVLNFPFSGESSPISDWLPENSSDLNNLSHITAVSLLLYKESNYARFKGPSGQLRLYSRWLDGRPSWNVAQCRVIRSFERFNLSNTQRLAVTRYTPSPRETVDGSPIFQTLLSMNDLRTLTLIKCENLSFIHALNPERNSSGTVACPNLEEFVLYIEEPDRFYTSELKEMVSARTRRYSRRPSIVIVSQGRTLPKEVFTLRGCFSHVEYKVDVESPTWDAIPDDESGRRVETVLVV